MYIKEWNINIWAFPHKKTGTKRVFSTLSMCSYYMLSNKLWLYCPMPNHLDMGLFTIMQNHFCSICQFWKKGLWPTGVGTCYCEKVFRRSHALFSELANAKKWFCMVVSNPLSRRLGNITKVYLTTCGQSTCSKLKNTNLPGTLAWNCPYIMYCAYSKGLCVQLVKIYAFNMYIHFNPA